jgi:hypothetical protein
MFSFEEAAKLALGAKEQDAGLGTVEADLGGDLVVGEVAIETEYQRDAVARGQLAYGIADCAGAFADKQGIEGRIQLSRVSRAGRRSVGRVEARGVEEAALAGMAAEPIDGGVGGDAEDPIAEGNAAIVGGESARKPQEEIAGDVFGRLAGGQQVSGEAEDVRAEVDMNVVMTGDGRFVEVQGTAEGEPFDRLLLDRLLELAGVGCHDLTAIQDRALG